MAGSRIDYGYTWRTWSGREIRNRHDKYAVKARQRVIRLYGPRSNPKKPLNNIK